MIGFVDLLLTCANRAEADKIARALLEKRLIACAKFVPIDSTYIWQGKITDDKEVLLVMESRDDLFEAVEAAVADLHTYKTFVLKAVPLMTVSRQAVDWLDKELRAKENNK